MFFQNLNDIMVFALDADDRLLCADQLSGCLEPLNDLVGIHGHQLLIHPEQRFALRAVHEDVFGLAVQLGMGWESRTASADNTGFFHLLKKTHNEHLLLLAKFTVFINNANYRGIHGNRIVTNHSSRTGTGGYDYAFSNAGADDIHNDQTFASVRAAADHFGQHELQSIQRLCFSGCPDRIDQFHR